MIEIEEVDIFVLDVITNKKYLFQVPMNIKALDLKKKLVLLLSTDNFEFRHHSKLYQDNQIISFEQGDTIYVYKKEEKANTRIEEAYVQNKGNNIEKLTGVFKLCLIKYISDKIIDAKIIKKESLRNIVDEVKSYFVLFIDRYKNININLNGKKELNIISFANYVSSEINDNEINNLLTNFDQMYIKDIFNFWDILSKYQKYNKFFDEDLPKILKHSYFEYSISGIQLLNIFDNKEYFRHYENCPNKEVKYLLHEIQTNSQNEINNNNLLKYSKKPFFGMGIYFTNKIDYISYIREKNIFKESFSCNISQIYYDKNLKQNIKDFKYYTKELPNNPSYEEINRNYSNKKVIKNGIHIVKVKADSRQIISEEELIKKNINTNFVANEYIITEKEQILPLFNIYFKKNDKLIIWRDPSYNTNTQYNFMFKLSQSFIYKNDRMNIYFENNIESALELVKRKKFNKIILISNIGMDLSGKRFVEISRKILGFPVIALFFSKNNAHLNWLKDFPNVLFTNSINDFQKFIMNFNEKGLPNLKAEIEHHNKIKLNFQNNFFSYPKFIKNNNYKNIIFEEFTPYSRKVAIKNIKNMNLLCMDYLGNILFLPQKKINNNYSYIWYITIIDDNITLFNNQFYLGFDCNGKKIVKDEFMRKWKINLVNNTYFLFYFESYENILTDFNNQALAQKQNEKFYNQLFAISDIIEEDDI